MPPPPKAISAKTQQQDGEGEPVLAALLDLGEAALARLAGLGRLGGGGLGAGARLGVGALAVLAQPVGHQTHSVVDRLEGLARPGGGRR